MELLAVVTITKPKSWITNQQRNGREANRGFLRVISYFNSFQNHGLKTVIRRPEPRNNTRTGSRLSSFFFPEPVEQKRIADWLSSLDALINAESQKLEALKTHKKGLMQQLFPSAEDIDA